MHNKIVIVFGKKGSGKTFFVKNKLLPQFPKYIIVDTLGEYEEGVVIETLHDLVNYLLRNFRHNYHIVFRDSAFNREDLGGISVFTLGYSALSACIVIEELDTYCSAIKKDIGVERLLRYGRHRWVSVIGISRRPAEVPKTITSQADILISFRQQEPRDLAYIAQLTSPEFAQRLPELGDYEVAVYAFNPATAKELGLEYFQPPSTPEKTA